MSIGRVSSYLLVTQKQIAIKNLETPSTAQRKLLEDTYRAGASQRIENVPKSEIDVKSHKNKRSNTIAEILRSVRKLK